MIILIDNYDSFTYNLAQQIEVLGERVRVIKNDELTLSEIAALKPKKIVISPGPKAPNDSGISMAAIDYFYRKLPILGVCLGHQCIGQLFGATVVHAPKVVHGLTSRINHDGSGLFKNMPNPFDAARYHSLVIDRVPKHFRLSAWTDDKTIMAIQHNEFPLYGIQFHPESFMTKHGNQLMKNFLHA